MKVAHLGEGGSSRKKSVSIVTGFANAVKFTQSSQATRRTQNPLCW